MEQHLEENHICKVCHQVFEEKYELIKHIQVHINSTQRKVKLFYVISLYFWSHLLLESTRAYTKGWGGSAPPRVSSEMKKSFRKNFAFFANDVKICIIYFRIVFASEGWGVIKFKYHTFSISKRNNIEGRDLHYMFYLFMKILILLSYM